MGKCVGENENLQILSQQKNDHLLHIKIKISKNISKSFATKQVNN